MKFDFLLLAVFLASACHQNDIVADLTEAAADASMPTKDGGGEAFCDGAGPPILVNATGAQCGGQVAERAFRFGLCVCEDFVASHTLTTDAYDSRRGPYTSGRAGGSVGVNGRFAVNASADIGGSLLIGGTGGLQSGGLPIVVRRRLLDNGPVASDGALSVEENAAINGSVRAANLTVLGSLTVPDAALINVSGTTNVDQIIEAPVSVMPPCDCGPSVVDIAGYTENHRTNNDNALINLGPRDLQNISGATTLTLPCGRFFLDRISGQGALTLEITGRVVLFVGEDFAPGGAFSINLEPGAELDLFIANNIVASNRIQFGDSSVAARVRVYVGGSGTIQLDAGATFAGNLYAPRADLTSAGSVEAFGSIFVRRVAISDRLSIHYDVAINEAGADCPEPAPDQCDACVRNEDCCAPMVCLNSQCSPEF